MLKTHANQFAVALLGFLLITGCSKKDLSSTDAEKNIINKEIAATYSANSDRAKTQAYHYSFSIPLDGTVLSGCGGEQITLSGEFRSQVHGVIYPDNSVKETVHNIEDGKGIGESGRKYIFKVVSVEKITTKKVDECSLALDYFINYRILSNGPNNNFYLKVHTTGFFDFCTQTNYGVETRITEECR